VYIVCLGCILSEGCKDRGNACEKFKLNVLAQAGTAYPVFLSLDKGLSTSLFPDLLVELWMARSPFVEGRTAKPLSSQRGGEALSVTIETEVDPVDVVGFHIPNYPTNNPTCQLAWGLTKVWNVVE